ncbi:hypothetical protein AB9Q10_37725, partial [Streptomyces krungchingensis]
MIDSYEEAVACAEAALRDARRVTVPDALRTFTARWAEGKFPAYGDDDLASVMRLAWLLYQMGVTDASYALVKQLVSHPPQGRPPGGDPNRCAVLLTCLGRPDEAQQLLAGDQTEAVLPPRGIEQDGTTGAESPPTAEEDGARPARPPAPRSGGAGRPGWSRIRALVNLAAISARTQPTQAAHWLTQAEGHLDAASGTPPAEIRQLLAGVRVSLARREKPQDVYDAPMTELRDASLAALAALDSRDPQGYLIVAQLALAYFESARDAQSSDRLEHAAGVLEAASQRLSAMLGADHPRALVVQGKLAAVQVECARAARSTARLDRATTQLAFISTRLSRRLGACHPQSLAATGNLAVARLECVRTTTEHTRSAQIFQDLGWQCRTVTDLVGADHPVARLVTASYTVCRNLLDRGGDSWHGVPSSYRPHRRHGASGALSVHASASWQAAAHIRPGAARPATTATVRPTQATAPAVAVNDVGDEEAFLAAIDETIKYFNDGDIVDGVIVKVDR